MEKMSFNEALTKYLTLMSRIESGESDLNLLKDLAEGYKLAVLDLIGEDKFDLIMEYLEDGK